MYKIKWYCIYVKFSYNVCKNRLSFDSILKMGPKAGDFKNVKLKKQIQNDLLS